ncbi:MAG: hypothetical protein GWO87_03395, partial [Xanthomonadaceae bacterium]|nr:hypothetical protein [Rhodospirillaceae bacterium]NIA18206.1 hypothetical protein [Xanthomonadaceae bacterium]
GTTKQSRGLTILFRGLLRFARNDRQYSGNRFAPSSRSFLAKTAEFMYFVIQKN